MAMPTFITIGAMKCGTGSLHRYLGLHPAIGMSRRKEIDFFIAERNYKKGLPWYESHFDPKYLVRGYTSPNYSKYHKFAGVPERMHAMLPDIKLIYIVRNPIDRIISQYIHNVSRTWEQRSITEALSSFENNHYVLTGCYMTQIEHFRKYYRDSQIHILLTEDLSSRPEQTMSEVFRFLNVDPDFSSEMFHITHNQSSNRVIDRPLARKLKRYPVFRQVKKRLQRYTYLRTVFGSSIQRPALSNPLKERLMSYYDNELSLLEAYVGRKLPYKLD